MEHVREMVTGPIIPTPGAVMECTKLLYEYLGDLIVLDVGGATTDLHSVTVESDQVARLMISPEPKAKRTVEGDLGVYVNRWKVVESIGEEKLREQCREQGFSMEHALETYRAIPKTEEEVKLVELLTRGRGKGGGAARRQAAVYLRPLRTQHGGRGQGFDAGQIHRGHRRRPHPAAPP